MVLSLNEKTDVIEPAKIKGLLDMGVKSIYEIETEDDKKIRTTGNHPYLTKNGWIKVSELKENQEIAVAKSFFFLNGETVDNISQSNGNGQDPSADINQKHTLTELIHNSLAKDIAKYKNSIANQETLSTKNPTTNSEVLEDSTLQGFQVDADDTSIANQETLSRPIKPLSKGFRN
ncbi:hypothetical protein KJ695_05295, partial [Patescibacteria group bacterium]|nr:hypothetical protein [Patescibacteria group bacterium]